MDILSYQKPDSSCAIDSGLGRTWPVLLRSVCSCRFTCSWRVRRQISCFHRQGCEPHGSDIVVFNLSSTSWPVRSSLAFSTRTASTR